MKSPDFRDSRKLAIFIHTESIFTITFRTLKKFMIREYTFSKGAFQFYYSIHVFSSKYSWVFNKRAANLIVF